MVLIRYSQLQHQENHLGRLSVRPEGKSRGNTVSCTLVTRCGAAFWHGAVVHSLFLSPELSGQGGSFFLSGTKNWTALQLYQDGHLIGLNEQMRGDHIRWLSSVTIRKLERSSWGDCCCGIEDVHDRAILIRIKASQPTNRVRSIKLPDGWWM